MAVAILIVLALVGYYVFQQSNQYSDIVVPAPTEKRQDLLYGYYSCKDDQVAETIDHVNAFNESQFDGPDKCVANILAMKRFTILDVSYQLFAGAVAPKILRDDARNRLIAFFDMLKLAGALKYVKALIPVDEPNSSTTESDLTSAMVILRGVAAMYAELSDVKFVCIYAADKSFICQSLFDWVGFDDYQRKSSILTGQYVKLKASLCAGQRTVLLPGGAYGQDPVPFMNFAQANPEVAMVMPFLWFDDTTGGVGTTGIRSKSVKQAYIDAGKSV